MSLDEKQKGTEWQTVAFGEICDLVRSSTTPDPNGNRIYIGLEHMQSGFPEFLGHGVESEVKSGKAAFQVGDVLFGKLRPYLRKSALASFDGICSTDILVFRPQRNIDPGFLSYLVHSKVVMDRAIATQSGVQHPRTSWSGLKDLELDVPPFDEQRKIAAVLSLVQRAIEQQERLIALTTELKKALMHKLFTEGLHGEPQKETEIGLIPESWEVKSLENLCFLQRGFDITKSEQGVGNVPVVSSGGIGSYHDKALVKGPGVVIGRKGTLGTVHYVEDAFWPHDTTLWVKDFKGNYPLYVSYALKFHRLERFDTGATNPTLNRNLIHPLPIAIPPLDDQIEIATKLQAVDSLTKTAGAKAVLLQELFHTLLNQLMTAQIRVDELYLTEVTND